MTKIYVLDIETTGLDGARAGDKVLEAGVASYDLDTGVVAPEWDDLVFNDLAPRERTAWVFDHSDLRPIEVENPANDDIHEAVVILTSMAEAHPGDAWTSYNRAFDFGLFLKPLGFDPERAAPCIMETYMEAEGLDRWVGAWAAYRDLCPSDPAELGGREAHRALKDAVMEAYILRAMCARWPWVEKAYRAAVL